MDAKKRTVKSPGKSVLFPLLVFLFALLSLFGLISSFSAGSMENALEKTKRALTQKERDLTSLFFLLQEGSLQMEGKDLLLSWNGDLTDRYSLSMKKEKEDLSLYGSEETLTLSSDTLFPSPLTSSRNGAAQKFSDSIFNEENTDPADFFALRLLLALTDPALEENDALDGILSAARGARPIRTKETGSFEQGRKEGVFYRYEFRSEQLVRVLQGLVKEARDTETRNNAAAVVSLLYALAGKDVPADLSGSLSSFSEGRGALYDALSPLVGKADSFFALELFLVDGYAAGMKADFEIGDYEGSARLDLGDDVKKSTEQFLSFSVRKEDEDLLSLSLRLAVTDDSEMAFIREAVIAVKDGENLLLPEGKTEENATLRFSWGREKGDLGLKWITDEEEFTLRGNLDSYKRGREAAVTVKRMEKGKENLLKDGAVSLSLTAKKTVLSAPEGGTELFCDGDGKISLKEAYEQAKRELVEEITQ